MFQGPLECLTENAVGVLQFVGDVNMCLRPLLMAAVYVIPTNNVIGKRAGHASERANIRVFYASILLRLFNHQPYH